MQLAGLTHSAFRPTARRENVYDGICFEWRSSSGDLNFFPHPFGLVQAANSFGVVGLISPFRELTGSPLSGKHGARSGPAAGYL